MAGYHATMRRPIRSGEGPPFARPLFLVLVAGIAAAAAIPYPAVPRAAAQGTSYALVRRAAFVYASPDASGEKARDPWAGRYTERIGPFFVMRFVGEHDGWVELATIPTFRATDHCYPTVRALDGMDLHLFVRRDDLAPVTASRVERTFDDGTALRLVSGVGLEARGPRRYDAFVRGATLRVELAPSEVATRYQPSERIALPRSAAGLLAGGIRVEFGRGGRLVTERASRPRAGAARRGVVDFSVDDTRRSFDDGPARASLIVEGPLGRGRSVATVRNACVEVVGQIDARSVTNERPSRSIDAPGTHDGTSLRPGTALFWPDGSRAGHVVEGATLDGSPRIDGGRACFDHPLRAGGSGADETLTLCVDRDAVRERRASRGRAFGRVRE